MFKKLMAQPADNILELMQMYSEDVREKKIDQSVGVYKNSDGLTPVMRAVKVAEQRIWENQKTKSYVGLVGDHEFLGAMIGLVLGNSVSPVNIAASATPGGSGACRQAFEMIRMADPTARVFVSSPTWPNHLSVLYYLGIETVEYRYFDNETCTVDFGGMIEDLKNARSGDVVLLHGCCHNPTGADLSLFQWQEVVDLINARGLIAMIDIAYQGFGDGLDEDALATRLVASSVDECLIAASCSKNFGIYRERTGLLMAIAADSGQTKSNQSTLAFLNRQNYSFPPDHGARVVTTILQDEVLRGDWAAELQEVRQSMQLLRRYLAAELQRLTRSHRFDFIIKHRGMFSRLSTTPKQLEELRVEHGIYMVEGSRLNIAGLNSTTVPMLAEAIVAVDI